MRPKYKRFVAALLGAVTLVSPSAAFADGMCARYAQVQSDSTGGSYVGGLLIYESSGDIARTNERTTITVTTTVSNNLGIPGGGPSTGTSTTVSTTTTPATTTVTAAEPIGYYAMNDGSVYQINCITGETIQVRAAN